MVQLWSINITMLANFDNLIVSLVHRDISYQLCMIIQSDKHNSPAIGLSCRILSNDYLG